MWILCCAAASPGTFGPIWGATRRRFRRVIWRSLPRLQKDYLLPPTFITENGGAFADEMRQCEIHDVDWQRYVTEHIGAAAAALRQGVPKAGNRVWSLLDIFEWASGYARRFGIVHVDYASQKRTLKHSAH